MAIAPSTRAFRHIGIAGLLLLAACASGCGKRTGDVSGRVYYQGELVRLGWVTIIDSDNQARQGPIADDGSFLVKRITPGPAKILVVSPDPRLSGSPGDGGSGSPEGPSAATLSSAMAKWRPIDEKYGEFYRTTLEMTVERGPNQFDIRMD